MILKTVEITNFRNYAQEKVELNDNINFFIGENGQGKTNFLEMVYYLALGRSFKNIKDDEIINWHKDFFKIKGTLYKENINRDFEIEITYERKGKKTIKINGVIYRKLSDLLGVLQVSTFTPEDLTIIKDGPQKRRKYMDLEISQLKKGYYNNLLDYYRVIKQRNNLLKEINFNQENHALLEVWDNQLINLGSRIIKERMEFLKILVPLSRKFQWEISKGQEKLDITYNSVLVKNPYEGQKEIINNFKKEIKEKKQEEIKKGITLVGPHRDDLIFYINGKELKKYGSQGQQRSAVLSLKVAELKLFYNDTGDYPILLLDDVMSELDDTRRNFLTNIIRKNNIQSLITGANEELKGNSLAKEVFKVREGKIEKNKVNGFNPIRME